jgi:hypothetical protein
MTVQPLWEAQRGRAVDRLVQYTAIIALIAVLIVFSAAIHTSEDVEVLVAAVRRIALGSS